MKARHTLKPVYVCLLLALSAQAVLANPLNPTVVNGQASFATTGNALTVTNTPGTIINWQGFSIGASEITRFNQQSAASAVLNRVISNNPSSILGALQSNGRVFIVNPNGIVFGAGATVDVAGLVASSLNLSNADFLAGRYNFTQVLGAANISNAGNITAHDGGQIFLIAANVENTGVITAPNGEILLAAGHSVDLVNTSNPNLRVNITAPAGDATNVGQLIASAGSLGLFGTIVRNSGQVSADSATMQGGKIVFKASQRVEAGGMMSAQGAGGGNIAVLADMQAGIVHVSGTLDASAPNSGNGGFIETSAAHVQIANTAAVSTFSRNGTSGTWLIDPTDFTIAATDPLNGNSYMSNATLATSLGSGSVIIQTLAGGTGNGDIFVSDAVSWASANSLTLNAIRNVNIDAAIINSGTGNLIVRADLNGTSTGTVNFGGSGMVALSGGGRADLYYNPEAYDIPTTYTGNMSATPFTAWMLVNDVNQLQAMNTNLTGKYALGANIDATATSGWNEGAGFVPVGSSDGSFAGQFDGLNHTISNLFINMPSTNYAGLFGYMRSGSALRNVGLVGGSVSGNLYVGGLVGKNYGSISNAYATGSVNGTNYVGGLVGKNYGSISNAYATGSVTGVTYVGGLAGYNDSSGGTISNSYATGSVSRDGNFGGGLVGLNSGTVSNSFWDTQTSGQTSLGAGTGMTTAQMQQQANFTSNTPANGNVNPDWDFAGTWVIYDGFTHPLLRSFMTPLTVTANNDTKTYDGQAYSGGNGVSYSSPPNANLLGTVSYGGTSQGAINSGNYVITPGGLYSNQQGYILSYVDGALIVNSAPATAPATTPVVPQPVISSLVSMSIPAINIPFNPPVPPVLMQAPTIDEINLLGPTAAGSDNPDDQAALDAVAAGTASVTVAEAAPLPVCR